MQEQVSQQTTEATATQLPDAQEQALDEYPMPDPALTQDDLEKCGYLDGDLLPLSKERAYELMERDLTVYIVQEGENPEMAFDTAETWTPMTGYLCCVPRGMGAKPGLSRKGFGTTGSAVGTGTGSFFPMREIVLLFIR